MTVPILPPLPIEWEEQPRPFWCAIGKVAGLAVVSIHREGPFYNARAEGWPLGFGRVKSVEAGRYRSLDKAKAAGIKAAQQEWQRFVESLYPFA